MSRHAQLPPRCPLQKKPMAPQANMSVSPPTSWRDIELNPRPCGHYKSYSQDSIFEELPAWLNDMLSDSDSNSIETSDSFDPDDGLGSSGNYGPNSPRMKNKSSFPEKDIVSLFSEYVKRNPVPLLDGYASASGIEWLDSFGDCMASVGNLSNKPIKRHPGQRSRARKLQYIADLEKAVNALQNLGAELSVRIGALMHQHALLSVENNTLKQQLLRIKQEKFIVDGEHEILKEEAERLKIRLAVSSNEITENTWNMLDMRKLDLN